MYVVYEDDLNQKGPIVAVYTVFSTERFGGREALWLDVKEQIIYSAFGSDRVYIHPIPQKYYGRRPGQGYSTVVLRRFLSHCKKYLRPECRLGWDATPEEKQILEKFLEESLST